MTKREVVVDIMRKHHYEIMLLSETNVNTCGCEKWNDYTCFFSTDIDPKVKEKEDKRREQNKGRGKGQPQGINYRLAPDFENAGVAIVIKNTLAGALKEVKPLNGRIMKVTFQAHGSDISFIAAYAPHSLHEIDTKEMFYNQLSDETAFIMSVETSTHVYIM